MTPSMQQPQPSEKLNRIRQKTIGWRGDGQQVPGNEPGGANGRYGGFGQKPEAAIPQQFSDSVQRAAENFTSSPAGGIIKAAHDRYGSQGRMNRGMNQMQGNMRQGDMAANAASLQSEPRPPMQSGIRYGESVEDLPQGGPDAGAQPPQPDSQPVQYGQPLQRGRENDSRQPDIDYGTPQQTQPQPAQPQQSFASPFGNMNFGTPQMADGGVITEPTNAILGEDGPEAVIPLDNPDAKITPGMFSSRRYRPTTGPEMTRNPIPPMAPASQDQQMKNYRR